jgi:GH25 family lysozyme M1 (1,4-beta-N-acetylmuramidase)
MPDITNAIVDLSHHNSNLDFERAKASGLVGVIHKATQGTTGIDLTYADRRPTAEKTGLLWGAYHFGTGSDGVKQAQHFLATVGSLEGVLLVLDLEDNLTGPSMPLEEARAFTRHIHTETGRWPGLYSGHYIKHLLGSSQDPVLANCWFWLAQYGPTAVVPANWKTWTLWQYTDGSIGPEPHEVPGIGRCDRDKFNGSSEALKAFWAARTP